MCRQRVDVDWVQNRQSALGVVGVLWVSRKGTHLFWEAVHAVDMCFVAGSDSGSGLW